MHEVINTDIRSIRLYGKEINIGDSIYIIKDILEPTDTVKYIDKIIYIYDNTSNNENIIVKMKDTYIYEIPVSIDLKMRGRRLYQIIIKTSKANTAALTEKVKNDIGVDVKTNDVYQFNIVKNNLMFSSKNKEDYFLIKISSV